MSEVVEKLKELAEKWCQVAIKGDTAACCHIKCANELESLIPEIEAEHDAKLLRAAKLEKARAALEESQWFADNIEYSESSGRSVENRLAIKRAQLEAALKAAKERADDSSSKRAEELGSHPQSAHTCLGYPHCDGNLLGEPHEVNCPAAKPRTEEGKSNG